MKAAQLNFPDIDFAYDALPDLHDYLDKLREKGAVVPVQYWNKPAWLITRFDELKQAFTDEEHFEAAASYKEIALPSMGKTMQNMVGEEHRINRGLVSGAFFPAQVRALAESLVIPVAEELLDKIQGKEQVDLVKEFIRPYPFTVISRMLGLPVNDQDKMLEWAVKLIDYPWDPEGALKAKQDFSDYLKPLVDARRGGAGEDLLTLVANAEYEGKHLDDEAVFSFVRMLFPAGSDTTFLVGGSMFAAVMADPMLRALTQAGDKEREGIVQEAIRMSSPTALLPRVCSKDTELGGVSLKAGERVLFGIICANSDSRVFPDPHTFDHTRTTKSLAFGNGQHFCVGSNLARLELREALRLVFQRFPNITFTDKKPQITGAVLRGPREFMVNLNG
ncbi:cytochrome P450 [Halieaceae bacterium]|nr:cytochrome P450 [Halieaceae bacterium]